MIITIGKFEITSGFLNITDPCYDIDTWCAAFELPAKNGKWCGEIDLLDIPDWGTRVSKLIAYHIENKKDKVTRRINAHIGVDSGQAGIFDSSVYPIGNTGEYNELDTFYGKCCNATLNNKNPAGIINNMGIVSSSGIGDGSYTAKVKKEKGKIVKLEVDFLDHILLM